MAHPGRNPYLLFGADGTLKAQLWLTDEEAALRPDVEPGEAPEAEPGKLIRRVDGVLVSVDPFTPPGEAQRLASAKAAAARAVNLRRDAEIAQPIEYAGALLDANAVAQANVKNKLEELRAAEELGVSLDPEMLFWIDYMNGVRTFHSVAEMRAWLLGLVLAISERGTRAYFKAIQLKQQIAAAATTQQVNDLLSETSTSEDL